MRRKKFWMVLAAGCMAILVSACGAQEKTTAAKTESEPAMESTETNLETASSQPSNDKAVNAEILVQGYEWGPGVPKIILDLGQDVSELSAGSCTVTTAGTERTVTDIYLCNENGEKTENPSRYAAIEMTTTSEISGSPFVYDISVSLNKWADTYKVTVDCADFTLDGNPMPLVINQDCINRRVCPDAERFANRNAFTGTYLNLYTNEEEELTLRTAAYEPEAIAGEEKNPLLIWLHGQGEGGTDPEIAILGNEVTALAREEIQSYFSSGDEIGAYVLAIQCETYWMDEGDGANGNGSGVSRYTEILMDTIEDYVSSNPDIDQNRIYLGGCSNGGYMTINMLINYPDYFAAAYPCCEAYAFYEYERNEDGSYQKNEDAGEGTSAFVMSDRRWLTKEKVELLKNIPIWFVVSADDAIVNPRYYVLPTYQALVQAGAKNAWLSIFESVEGTDHPDNSYPGHFSWIYLFNNQVTRVQDPEKIAASSDLESFGTVPTNEGGGSLTVEDFSGVFAWLNAQKKH